MVDKSSLAHGRGFHGTLSYFATRHIFLGPAENCLLVVQKLHYSQAVSQPAHANLDGKLWPIRASPGDEVVNESAKRQTGLKEV